MRAVLTLLLLALPLSAFAANPASVPSEKRSRWATSVKQDANLYRIDDKLYRSEQPVADDGDTIEKLGIKSVINLRYFDRNDNDTHLKNRGLTLLNRPLRSWRIKPEDIAQTLYLIEKQQRQGAVLIHCYHGADRTGLISGMYRIYLSRLDGGRCKRGNAARPLRLPQHLEKHRQPVYRKDRETGQTTFGGTAARAEMTPTVSFNRPSRITEKAV